MWQGHYVCHGSWLPSSPLWWAASMEHIEESVSESIKIEHTSFVLVIPVPPLPLLPPAGTGWCWVLHNCSLQVAPQHLLYALSIQCWKLFLALHVCLRPQTIPPFAFPSHMRTNCSSLACLSPIHPPLPLTLVHSTCLPWCSRAQLGDCSRKINSWSSTSLWILR